MAFHVTQNTIQKYLAGLSAEQKAALLERESRTFPRECRWTDDFKLEIAAEKEIRRRAATPVPDSKSVAPGLEPLDFNAQVVGEIADVIRNFVKGEIQKITSRVERLERSGRDDKGANELSQRISKLEALADAQGLADKRSSRTVVTRRGADGNLVADIFEPSAKSEAQLKYCGVFEQGRDYAEGNFCTLSGSLWHCNRTGTKARPGDGSPDWTLAVKGQHK